MTYVSSAPLLARSDTSWLTEWRRTLDWGLVGGALFLMAIGMLLSLAAGPSAAARIGYDNEYYFVFRQAIFVAASGVIMIGVSMLDRSWARRFATLVFIGGLAMMFYILLWGHEAKGAQRWVQVAGFTAQPSEVVKPALIVLSGWLLAQRELYPTGPWAIIAFLFYAVTLGLLLLQPDVGQSVLLTAAFVVTFFVSGLPWRWAAGFGVGGISLSALLYALLPHVRVRINSFIDPSSADTYQIDKAAEAIGRGGLFGVGPGEGQVKLHLPDAHTDFIFAVMAEEYGLIAALVLMSIFVLVIIRGFRASARVDDGYARAASAGLFTLFGLQAAINIAVNLALIPPKGMTLPFVSSGGSSMIGTGLTLGLALALVRGQGTRTRGRYG
ncbi:FtsW/RodA/SpoVE family cell cycle protein [Hyphomonas beringensis]|uniref:FtsW/RodA/SpoVE family cell cycle protein n=1 Tax=Hyphomonas beringensis TaxID=1280946 RepID=UPI00068F0546|nr:putative peptidoglycan glycosyltransferase FtsW [Hyphomonas beringensis]